MYPAPIDAYFSPESLEESVALLGRFGPRCRVVAGGQSLLPLLKAREIRPDALIDLNRVRGLSRLELEGGFVGIGALVRHRDLTRSSALGGAYGALVDAAGAIGDLQVRNWGTPVGSLAHRDHTGDIAPAACVLEGRLHAIDEAGAEANDSLAEFLQRADLEPRLITRLEFPRAGGGSAYQKYGRVEQDRAILGVAVWLEARDTRCVAARVAVGGLIPGARRLQEVEAALVAAELDDAGLSEVADLAARTTPTQTDALGSAAYRCQLLRVGLPIAVKRALLRARAAT